METVQAGTGGLARTLASEEMALLTGFYELLERLGKILIIVDLSYNVRKFGDKVGPRGRYE